MTSPIINTDAHTRRRWRSAGAVLLGFITVVVLSLGTDQLLHVLQVYPPWGQPMYDPGLNLLRYPIASFTPFSGATSPRGSRPIRRCFMFGC
jgi:hypothetical protein